MTTLLLQPSAPLRRGVTPDRSPQSVMSDRVLDIVMPLTQVSSQRQLNSALGRAAVDYAPIRTLMTTHLAVAAHKEELSGEGLVHEINASLWDALLPTDNGLFSPEDRKIILAVLQEQMESATLANGVAPEHEQQFYAVILDGYWAWLKVDLCLTTILGIADGTVEKPETEIIHWLRLAARRFMGKFQSAVFANSPVLKDRLERTSIETISTHELEKRLGLLDAVAR